MEVSLLTNLLQVSPSLYTLSLTIVVARLLLQFTQLLRPQLQAPLTFQNSQTSPIVPSNKCVLQDLPATPFEHLLQNYRSFVNNPNLSCKLF